ncbi:hypothetical protein COO60DRAFT_1529087 [Scenedesmus sp. NREL 46B-D3]|nr:hypothetical protein COO60DRAFT_1529087 [Scenedesmus sp. NREL 46B-D3]
MDYPRRRRAPKPTPGTTSPLQSNAPDAAAAAADPKGSSKEDDGWAQLEQWRGMSLEVYQTIIANDPAAEGGERAPRPNKPANKGPNQRRTHAWTGTGMMDEEDKLRAKQDALGFMKDHEAIARIARTAQSTEGAVRDLLHSFHRRRDFADLMLQHREEGKPMPLTGMRRPSSRCTTSCSSRGHNVREHLAVLRKFRDPENCQLKAWAAVVGRNRKCPRTDLPYRDCCGSKLGTKAVRR